MPAQTPIQRAIQTHQAGHLDDAAAAYQQIIATAPTHPDAWRLLAMVEHSRGNSEEAISLFTQALTIRPTDALAFNGRGICLAEAGRLTQALADFDRVRHLAPDFADGHFNYANTLQRQGELDEAVTSYRTALRLKPTLVEALHNLGNGLRELGHSDEAVECHQQAIRLRPDWAEAYASLGSALQDLGHFDDAVANFRHALSIDSRCLAALGNLAYSYTVAARPPAECLEVARDFGRVVESQVSHPFDAWQCTRNPERLRVGFVSGDLCQHPVGYFTERIFAGFDPLQVELFAYPTRHVEDQLSARIKPLFSVWRSIADMCDETAAQVIHDDRLHILVDLAGHTGNNRLGVFAWKPAPVQVTWLGYFGTTGMSTIDYLVGDPWTVPLGNESHFTELVYRLPDTKLCGAAPDLNVEPTQLPALTNGYITFGCFSNLPKVNPQMILLFSRVMLAVPGSRLIMMAKQLADAKCCRSVAAQFLQHGINAERITLRSATPRKEYFAAYHEVDLMLDTQPYPGGTTSIDSLWMGVPVLTMAGRNMLGLQGVGIMMNAELPDWIASDSEGYLKLAVRHCSDLNALAALRRRLRQQVERSPLFDSARFAGNFEKALRTMWAQWQKGETAND